VTPRFGAVSLLPLPGVIDNRTPVAAAPDPLPTLAWLPPWLAATVEPPEQAATSNPNVAQTATAASPWPRNPEDRKEMTCEMAAGRNFEPPDCTDTAYAAPAHLTPVARLTPVRTTPGHLSANPEEAARHPDRRDPPPVTDAVGAAGDLETANSAAPRPNSERRSPLEHNRTPPEQEPRRPASLLVRPGHAELTTRFAARSKPLGLEVRGGEPAPPQGQAAVADADYVCWAPTPSKRPTRRSRSRTRQRAECRN